MIKAKSIDRTTIFSALIVIDDDTHPIGFFWLVTKASFSKFQPGKFMAKQTGNLYRREENLVSHFAHSLTL